MGKKKVRAQGFPGNPETPPATRLEREGEREVGRERDREREREREGGRERGNERVVTTEQCRKKGDVIQTSFQ